MERINPTDCKEFRLKQAMEAIEFVGYEFLSSSDRQQVERLWYVDDLTESQYLHQRQMRRQEALSNLDDIAIRLGYKPSELYKQDVLNAVVNVSGEEYAKEINAKIQWKKRLENRLSGARIEQMKEQSKADGSANELTKAMLDDNQLQEAGEFAMAMYKTD